jgi:DNA-binding transcriptional LysR family regulator
MNLTDFDLNLIIIFDAIYQERSLTRAGQRLRLSQPAISHSLNKLRTAFDAPLFVRHGYSMEPTPLAEELIINIQKILELTEKTLEDRGAFNPALSTRVFSIGMQDNPMLIVLPRLIDEIQAKAPSIGFRIFHLNMENRKIALEDGKVDLVIGSKQGFSGNIYQQYLFKDREVCVMRQDHPVIGDTLTLEEYIEAEFISLAVSEFKGERIDSRLKELGYKRKIRIVMEHEVTFPRFVSDTDYLANVAGLVAREYSAWLPIKILPLPIQIGDFEFYQYWHVRQQMDPAHGWLRKEIKNACQKIDPI